MTMDVLGAVLALVLVFGCWAYRGWDDDEMRWR